MKKGLLVFLGLVVSVLFLTTTGYAGYLIKEWAGYTYNREPQINNTGDVVWVGFDGNDDEIFLYDGTTTIKLTDNDSGDYNPQIYDSGYVTWIGNGSISYFYDGSFPIQQGDCPACWNDPDDNEFSVSIQYYFFFLDDDTSGWGEKIFLSNSTTTTFLTATVSHGGDATPQVNNDGYVVWQEQVGEYPEIFLYDGSAIKQLSNEGYYDFGPEMNNNGNVVWQESGGDYPGFGAYPGNDIFLYDGTSTINLTNNGKFHYTPQTNIYGEVVWFGHDGDCSSPYVPWCDGSGIFLYDGTSTIKLTDGGFYNPRINNNGDVVWARYEGNNSEIYLDDGSSTIQLTNNDYNDYSPQINNSGEVVWYGYDGNDYEIFLNNGTTTLQLTDNDYNDYTPKINDNGDVFWGNAQVRFIATLDENSDRICTDIDGDGIGDECVEDADMDGFIYENDCNDFDPNINPYACDIKNDGIDQDCDGFDRKKGKPCSISGGGDSVDKEGPGQTCFDGIDNDGDGDIDCLDDGCAKRCK